MNKTKDITALILFVCIGVMSCGLDKLKIINDPAYAIGVIDDYTPYGSTAPQIQFQYKVRGINYASQYLDGGNGWNVPVSCGNCNTGNKFMVQYDSLQPSVARMLFNYPITDSADYKKYKLLFKNSPPSYPTP
jgi:hypothetical protein